MHPKAPSLAQHPRVSSLPQAAFTLAQFTLGGGQAEALAVSGAKPYFCVTFQAKYRDIFCGCNNASRG